MTQKLYFTLGLPASGKSSWARELVTKSQGRIKRVNKDDLRALIDSGVWSKNNEKEIVALQNLLVRRYLAAGYSVVVDNTNFGWEDHFQGIAKEFRAEFVLQDFTDVSVEECIKRDLTRFNSVGKDVIMGMYNKYLKPRPSPTTYTDQDSSLPSVVIFDIDGCLALMQDRSPFDWQRVDSDIPNGPVVDLAQQTHEAGKHQIVFMSGRDGSCRDLTHLWLKKHLGEWAFNCELFMRAAGDQRKDAIVKRELYDNHIKNRYRVAWICDDRDQVVRMWREDLGLPVFQVAYGDF